MDRAGMAPGPAYGKDPFRSAPEAAVSAYFRVDCPGRKIGYARVSTRDQKMRMQLDALKDVGCDLIFNDHGVSGAKDSRPGLDRMLDELRPGDTVIVFTLDRLGRSMLHLADLLARFGREEVHFCALAQGINTTLPGGKLAYYIFGILAEAQREMIVENTIAGLDAAKRRGKRLGRPPVLSEHDIAAAHHHVSQLGQPLTEVARLFNTNPATLRRGFERLSLYSIFANQQERENA